MIALPKTRQKPFYSTLRFFFAVMLYWDILLFCLGLGLLIKGADWLVESATRIAKQLGISNIVIGLTIVSLGTTLPELGASATAAFYGNSDLAIGNIIGSCIANLALVLALAGLFVPIALKKDIYRRDCPIMLFSGILFYLFCLGGIITRFEGAVLLVLFLIYISYFLFTKRVFRETFHFKRYLGDYGDTVKIAKFEDTPKLIKGLHQAFSKHFKKGAASFFSVLSDFGNYSKKNRNAIFFATKQVLILLIGVACIFFGSHFLVGAAMNFPLPPVFTGLVFVAIGTSLPELFVAISSLRKGLPEIMIGNLIGANISNLLWVGGITALIAPIIVPVSAIRIDFIFMLLIMWLFLVFFRGDRKISRIESITLLLFYAAFVAASYGANFWI